MCDEYHINIQQLSKNIGHTFFVLMVLKLRPREAIHFIRKEPSVSLLAVFCSHCWLLDPTYICADKDRSLQMASLGVPDQRHAQCVSTGGKMLVTLQNMPVLTTRHLSSRIRGKVYEACVCLTMLHDSETWGSNNPEQQRFRHNDHDMIHWIYGLKDRDETPSASLL